MNPFSLCIEKRCNEFKTLIKTLSYVFDDVDMRVGKNTINLISTNPSFTYSVCAFIPTKNLDSFYFDSNVKMNIELKDICNALEHKSINIHVNNKTLYINDHTFLPFNSIYKVIIPDTKYECFFKIPFNVFIDTCKTISKFDDYIIIEIDNNGLYLISLRDTKKRRTVCIDYKTNNKTYNALVRFGIFDIKCLSKSIELESICDGFVYFCLNRNDTLIVKFMISNFACMYLMMSSLIIDYRSPNLIVKLLH